MHGTMLTSLQALGLAAALLLAAGPALAEPEEEATEEEQGPSDEEFAKSFVGKTYDGDLEVEGWADFGGGLVSPPVYVHQYQRDDRTYLVLTSRELTPATREAPASYVVTDALIVSKLWKGYEFSMACTQGDDPTLNFMGEARGLEDSELWTDVRRAWEIEVEPESATEADEDAEAEAEPAAEPAPEPMPGKIKKANAARVKCLNPNW